MRLQDLTVEVRDRNLQRKGQITPAFLNMKAKVRWCQPGEWEVTLPGDHPMVPVLEEPGSGLLVYGPTGEVLSPRTYSDWAEEARNLLTNPSFETGTSLYNLRTNQSDNPTPLSTVGWAGPATLSVTTMSDGTPCLQQANSAAVTSYIFSDSGIGVYAPGEIYTLSAWVEFPDAGAVANDVFTVRAHSRAGNTYYGSGSFTMQASPEPQRISLVFTVPAGGVPDNDLDLSIVSNAVRPVGYRTRMGRLLIEKVAVLDDYFDGGTPAAGDFTYAWAGAAGSSVSYAKVLAPAGTSPGASSRWVSSEWALRPGTKSLRIRSNWATVGSAYVDLNSMSGITAAGVSGTRLVLSSTARVTHVRSRGPFIGIVYRVGTGGYQSVTDDAPNQPGVHPLRVALDVPVGTTEIYLRLYNGAPIGEPDVWFDDTLLAQGAYPGDYFAGDSFQPDDLVRFRWLGAAHASASVLERRTITAEPVKTTTIGPLFSGSTSAPKVEKNRQNPDGTYTFVGTTDEEILAGSLAFPDPTLSDPQASSQSRPNDTRSGKTEDLLRQYVGFNVTDLAPAGRRRGLRSRLRLRGASALRGVTQMRSPRFQNLLELCQEIVGFDPSLGFRIIQDDDLLYFEVLDSRDRRALVRFDVQNGSISSEQIMSAGPTVTQAIVAGQGEGSERIIVSRADATAVAEETAWAIPREVFIDRRDMADPVGLEQSGDERLAEGRALTSVKVVPSEDSTMLYGVDWRQGDLVTVVVGGQEAEALVTEVVFSIDSSGVLVGAGLGDLANFDPTSARAKTQDGIESRVGYLERVGTPQEPEPTPDVFQVTDWNAATLAGFYWGSGAANAPVASGLVMGRVERDGTRIVQECRDPAALLSRVYRRVFSGSWGAWKLVGSEGLPDPIAVVGSATNTVTATAWGTACPGIGTATLDLPAAAWVRVTCEAWMQGSGGDVRAGVRVSGATSIGANEQIGGTTAWGVAMWANGVYEQRSSSKIVRCNAGVNVFTLEAYRITAGGVNYPSFSVSPERWA